MALVSDGTFMNVALMDAAGNRASVNYDLAYADLAALNTADAAGDIAQMIADLEAVTEARVDTYRFGEKMIEAVDGFGDAGSEVENIALITAKIDGSPNKKHSLRLPAPVDGVFLGTTGEDRNIIDTTDTDLQAYLVNFGPSGEIEVSDGESIADPTATGAFKGKRIHRASRKG